MTHQNDPRTIESELERDRTSLASTINALQDRASIDHLAKEALGMIRTNAGAYTQSIDSAIRANPLALALTGVGVAWLIFGGGKSQRTEPRSRPIDPRAELHPHKTTPLSAAPSRGADTGWARRIDDLRERASAALRSIESDARAQMDDLRDYAGERARVLSEFTDSMKESFLDGLEGLSEEARDRVVRAREAAYAARLRVVASARDGGRELGRMIEEHPLVAGVVALALGAAFAAALPRTRVEDRAFGEDSDRLMASAADLLREERARLSRVAEGVADELKSSAHQAADAVAEKTAELGENVRERAEIEASKGEKEAAAADR